MKKRIHDSMISNYPLGIRLFKAKFPRNLTPSNHRNGSDFCNPLPSMEQVEEDHLSHRFSSTNLPQQDSVDLVG